MATRVWRGGSASRAQVDSVTPASVGVGNTFSVTRNGKTVTVTATAATVANVTGLLAAAMRASTEPEFRELSAADNTTNVLVTGPADGTPFTLTASASGGTATNTRAAVTAPLSPCDFATAANWSGTAVPASGDTVVYDSTSNVDCLYSLSQAAITGVTLTVNGYRGKVGLPSRNANGYPEDRATALAIGATTVTVNGSGGRFKLDTGPGGTTLTVLATGARSDDGEPAAVQWKGTGTNNVSVVAGDVSLAALAGEAATVAALRVGAGVGGTSAAVRGGAGLTLTTLDQSGGVVTLDAGLTTANLTGGTLTVTAGNITTANADGGVFYYRGTGTIGTLNVSDGGKADFSGDPRPRTVSAITLSGRCTLDDSGGTIAMPYNFVLSRIDLADATIRLGTHRTITVDVGP